MEIKSLHILESDKHKRFTKQSEYDEKGKRVNTEALRSCTVMAPLGNSSVKLGQRNTSGLAYFIIISL